METQHIVQALRKLFTVVGRIFERTGRNLAMHGAGQCGVQAVRRLNLSMGGVRIAYHQLGEQDKAVVDEAAICVVGFADQYFRHHKEKSEHRERLDSLENTLISHADEIMEAATNAVLARARSHAFDYAAGRPQRTAMFMDHDLRKQLLFALIDEFCSHLDGQTKPRGF